MIHNKNVEVPCINTLLEQFLKNSKVTGIIFFDKHDMWVDLFVWLNIIKTYHTAVAFLQFDCNLLNVDFKHFLCYFAFHFFWKHVLSFIWIEFVCCPYCDCTWHLSSVYRISFYTNYYNVNLVFDFLVHSGFYKSYHHN